MNKTGYSLQGGGSQKLELSKISSMRREHRYGRDEEKKNADTHRRERGAGGGGGARGTKGGERKRIRARIKMTGKEKKMSGKL